MIAVFYGGGATTYFRLREERGGDMEGHHEGGDGGGQAGSLGELQKAITRSVGLQFSAAQEMVREDGSF